MRENQGGMLANMIECPADYMQAQLELAKFLQEKQDAFSFDTVMSLTHTILDYNDGHYTAWYCRRRALEEAGNPEYYLMELEFIRQFTLIHPKNYQVWRHRECIVKRIGSVGDELEYLTFQGEGREEEGDDNSMDGIDAKNYHAWQYRQWLVKHFALPLESELSLINRLLSIDAHNNSAWNHRQFIRCMKKEWDAKSEMEFVDSVISKCKHANESATKYIQWIKALN
jgi:protein farnesyltransferase/geranylgeranyltransferase type-1 subunit alpha